KQIPCGDDRQKSKSNGKSNNNRNRRSLRDDKQKNEQQQRRPQRQRLWWAGGQFTSQTAVGYVRLHPPTHSPAWRRGRAPLERATGLVDSKPRRPAHQSSPDRVDVEKTQS